ncbi:MAG: 3-deoxy-D-manno-octulosonate 8-phosphate phosphatase, partial [Desulfobulbaceae bacterium]|nr:3-deoxy-D-manno-octulosonate 8-phosphate phosphatase [Desulfobulbaceae bacterium]
MKQDESCVAGTGGYPGDCELTQHLLKRAAARKKSDEKGYVRRSCFPKAEPIKLLLLDVDGVLTDGTIMYTHEGTEIKSFHTHDGLGLRLLKEAGVETGLITARSSRALARRAKDLSITHVYQDVSDKVEVYDKLLKELDL